MFNNTFRYAQAGQQSFPRNYVCMHWEPNLPPRGTFLCPGVTFSCPGVMLTLLLGLRMLVFYTKVPQWRNGRLRRAIPWVGAECPFGNLNATCKPLTFSQQQQLRESAIGHFCLVSILNRNTYTILERGGTSDPLHILTRFAQYFKVSVLIDWFVKKIG